MNKNKLILFMILMNVALMSGCQALYTAQQMPVTENWGRSFEAAQYVQRVHPDAGQNTQAVTSMEGRACQAVMESYYEQIQRERPETPICNIVLGKIESVHCAGDN